MTAQRKPIIVKVQLSITTSHRKCQVLIYNEERSLVYAGDSTKEVERALDGEFKKYFYAKIVGGKFVIGKPAKEQAW